MRPKRLYLLINLRSYVLSLNILFPPLTLTSTLTLTLTSTLTSTLTLTSTSTLALTSPS